MNLRQTFKHAFNGLGFFLRNESNAWIHSVISIIVIIAALIFPISLMEWVALLLCIGGVFSAEAFNTSIECLCDLKGREPDPNIKIVKDVSAGAVLIMAIISVVIGMIIFLPHILEWF